MKINYSIPFYIWNYIIWGEQEYLTPKELEKEFEKSVVKANQFKKIKGGGNHTFYYKDCSIMESYSWAYYIRADIFGEFEKGIYNCLIRRLDLPKETTINQLREILKNSFKIAVLKASLK